MYIVITVLFIVSIILSHVDVTQNHHCIYIMYLHVIMLWSLTGVFPSPLHLIQPPLLSLGCYTWYWLHFIPFPVT